MSIVYELVESVIVYMKKKITKWVKSVCTPISIGEPYHVDIKIKRYCLLKDIMDIICKVIKCWF